MAEGMDTWRVNGVGLLPEAAANGWELPGKSDRHRPLDIGQHFCYQAMSRLLVLSP